MVEVDDANPGAEEWKRAGDLCLEQGDLDGALEYYFNALRLEPEHAGVRYHLALVHLELDDYPAAMTLLKSVLASRPLDEEALTALGWAQLWNHEIEESIRTFRRAILAHPKHAPAQVGLGWAHMAESPPALGRAADAFARAIQLETDDPEAYHGLATACELRQEPAQAIPLLEQMLRLSEDDPRALEGLVRVHEDQGDWEAAATYLMRLAHQDPANPEHPRRLARIFDANGVPDRAAVFWRKYAKLAPEDAEATAALGDALLAADRPQEALDALAAAAEAFPHEARRHAAYGHACFEARRYEEAVAAYERAAALEPKVAAHYHNMGNAQLEGGQPGQALFSYQQALQLDPKLTDSRVGQGWASLELNNLEAACECFKLALEQAPGDVAALDGLGSALWREGRPAVALQVLQKAAELDPEQGGLRFKLGMIYEELGRFDEARRILTELVSGSYAEDRAVEALARIEARLGGS